MFFCQFKNYIKFHQNSIYGLTQDPTTKEYIFVMEYMKDGSLHDYLAKEFKNLNWKNKIGILLNIISGLKEIHEQSIIHHNLHSGNVLQSHHHSYIVDLGLSIPADQSSSASNKNNIYGVLP